MLARELVSKFKLSPYQSYINKHAVFVGHVGQVFLWCDYFYRITENVYGDKLHWETGKTYLTSNEKINEREDEDG